MARKILRIPIPVNPDEQITLAKSILAQHKKLGANSPIAGLNMDDFVAKVGLAENQNDLGKQLHKDGETAFQKRDNALGPQKGEEKPGTVKFYLRAARDTLAGQNRGNEQKLGDFGFTVDTTPKKSAPKKKSGGASGGPAAGA